MFDGDIPWYVWLPFLLIVGLGIPALLFLGDRLGW